ncbi:MAG: hypothetical protein H6836_05785 [Planctomycetes bacterium]|nr:hypothetical protein [Planctomycetota bacterium]MCB9889069.1 hypothetical protein [Planctomycetota bacterium]
MSRTAARGSVGRLLVAAFVMAWLPLLAWCWISPAQPTLPRDCDPFGYLQMADAFARGRVLGDHTARPFHDGLIAHLDARGFDHADYCWMVAPHAYHVDPVTRKVINQYPPATGYLLSHVPKPLRFAAFPPLSMLLLVVPMLMVMLPGSGGGGWFRLAAVAGVGLVCLWVPPLRQELRQVTSTAPTFGLLCAAGFAMRRNPGVSLLLLGASLPFRVANVVLAVPLLLWFALRPARTLTRTARRIALGSGLLLAGGGVLYLAYAQSLLGNAFRPTYSPIDQDWASAARIAQNLDYYFGADQGWMWVHVVVFGLLVCLSQGEPRLYRWTALLAALPACNYAFYLLHRVEVPYYPYASALLCGGALLEALDSHPGAGLLRRQVVVAVGLATLCIVPLVRIAPLSCVEQFERDAQVYRSELASYGVVWADASSGTVEYAAGVPAFRYTWAGSPRVRDAAIGFLRDAGVRQAILLEGERMQGDAVTAQLRAAGVAFTERRSRLGRLLVVD